MTRLLRVAFWCGFLWAALSLSLGCGGGYEYRLPKSAASAGPGSPAAAPSPSPQADRDADGVPDRDDIASEKGGEEGKKVAQAAPAKTAPTATDAHDISFLIYTAELTMAVFQVSRGMDAVEQIARDVGGYLSVRADNRVVIRVPRERFDDAIRRVEKLGDVVHRNVTAEDVTDEYVDLEIRLKNARALRDRLELLLKGAAVKDALEIEKELGRVTTDIEQMEGRLKLLRDKIAYSTITVDFQPLHAETVENHASLPFPWLQELGLPTLLSVHQ